MSELPDTRSFEPEDSADDPHPNSSVGDFEETWTPDPSSLLAPLAVFDSPFPAAEDAQSPDEQPGAGPPLFQSWSLPEALPQPRIPHLGHLLLLTLLALIGLLGTSLLTRSALHLHLFGISTVQQALTDIHYTLGSMAALYLLTLAASALVFPFFWHKSLFAGLQWRGATALKMGRRLFFAAFLCFLLALINGWFLPGPSDTPIDKLFRTPAAAWLMFAFGITFAPFFEEIAFRGFLLPTLCTALDWSAKRRKASLLLRWMPMATRSGPFSPWP